MNEVIIIADSAAEAMSKIRQALGSAAVVLSVRQLPQSILTRLWKKPRIEVVAHVPPGQPALIMEPDGRLSEMLEAVRLLNRQLPSLESGLESSLRGSPVPPPSRGSAAGFPSSSILEESDSDEEILAEALERWGLTLPNALTLMECMAAVGWEGGTLDEDWHQAREILSSWWERPSGGAGSVGQRHVFVGAPGSGKTTVLCKWMAQAVLLGEKSAGVWRIDARHRNTAEGLSACADVLGVTVERSWPGQEPPPEISFIDVPGTDWLDQGAIDEMAVRLEELEGSQVHLVLNAAYDRSLLLEQIGAFARLKPADLIFTHMDEETRWGKLWNCVMEKNQVIRFLGFGQNVTGTLKVATPEQLLPERLG